jgi:hypothetical protein
MTVNRSAWPDVRDPDSSDFSIVLGGPLYQLLRRAHLSDDTLALVHRRIVAGVLLTWVPLLLLTTLGGTVWWGEVGVPFLLNAEVHTRFLIAMPLLIVAELGVHRRMRQLVLHFYNRNLIRKEDEPRMTAAIASALRLRNSLAAEITLIILIYAVGIPMREYLAVDTRTWAFSAAGDHGFGSLTPAGWWQALVSVPVFQFLLVRWYFRMFIWARFLWQVSRLELRLLPTHPDRVGGLGFLSNVVYAFTPILLAHGVLLAGLIADRVFHDGAKLPQFTVEIIGGVGVLVFLVLAPLTAFAALLAGVRRKGLGEYGVMAQRYVREFDSKWLRGGASPAEPLIGSADIQSLADLGNSFEVIRSMRLVPFSKETVMQLAIVTAAPLTPLLLTMISFEELLKRLLTAIF